MDIHLSIRGSALTYLHPLNGLRNPRRSAIRRCARGRWHPSVRLRGGSQWWRPAQGRVISGSATWNAEGWQPGQSETRTPENPRESQGNMQWFDDVWYGVELRNQCRSFPIFSNRLELRMKFYFKITNVSWICHHMVDVAASITWFAQVSNFCWYLLLTFYYTPLVNPRKKHPQMIWHNMCSSSYWSCTLLYIHIS